MRPIPAACLVFGLGLLTLVCHCGFPQGSPTPTGELGNGQFLYLCPAGNADTGCAAIANAGDAGFSLDDAGLGAGRGYEDAEAGTTTFPKVIAVGSLFTVSYSVLGSDYTSVQGDTGYGYEVTPASPRLALPTADGSLHALRPGYEALLAATTGVGQVDDFVFVRFANIASLAASSPIVDVAIGGHTGLSVTAKDQDSETLAGRLECAWSTVSGGDAVLFQGSTNGAAVSVTGVALGEAHVKVSCGPASTEMVVRVEPSIEEDGGGGDAGNEAAADAGQGEAAVEGGDHG
jgi:hypothetical protein